MTVLLDADQLGMHLDRFRRRLFRLETLPAYAVESDGDDFRRWLAMDDALSERKQRWLNVLRRERAEGRITARIRVLSERLTDYERYSCAVGYAPNSEAGEDIRVLRTGEHPTDGVAEAGDFWLVDEDEALQMHYDEHGAFVGAEVLDPTHLDERRRLRDRVWGLAEPFPAWWARHPELHRGGAT